jgi:hypothetical protein
MASDILQLGARCAVLALGVFECAFAVVGAPLAAPVLRPPNKIKALHDRGLHFRISVQAPVEAERS